MEDRAENRALQAILKAKTYMLQPSPVSTWSYMVQVILLVLPSDLIVVSLNKVNALLNTDCQWNKKMLV